MEQAIIDGNIIKTKRELHEQLKLQLGFPEYYGHNLDALHDCLTDLRQGRIILRNFGALSECLGEYLDGFMEVLLDVCRDCPAFEVRIESGAASEGSYEEVELFE